MDTDAVLLVGRCERDGGDYGTGFWVRLRPNMDSARAETIMTRFKGCSGRGGTTVRENGRFVEVRGCRRHSGCAGGQGKETIGTFFGERVSFLYSLDPEVLWNFVIKTQSAMIDTVD